MSALQLNFPEYRFKIQKQDDKRFIFDKVRRKYVRLTPEEWVRQHTIEFLNHERGFPLSLISVEHTLTLNALKKRCDIVLFDNTGKALMIVECKAPSVQITQKAIDQIARYNISLQVGCLFVTNGLKHYVYEIDTEKQKVMTLSDIPYFDKIKT